MNYVHALVKLPIIIITIKLWLLYLWSFVLFLIRCMYVCGGLCIIFILLCKWIFSNFVHHFDIQNILHSNYNNVYTQKKKSTCVIVFVFLFMCIMIIFCILIFDILYSYLSPCFLKNCEYKLIMRGNNHHLLLNNNININAFRK